MASAAPTTVLAAQSAWTWSVVTAPSPAGEQSAFYQNELLGATCAGPTDCWAVGNTGTSQVTALIEHYDGTAWSAVSSPAVPGNLWSITCVSASNCWAVGRRDNTTTGTYSTLIEHFDGASWSVVTSPNVTQAQINSLQSVACTASACFAAGYSGVFVPYSPLPSVEQTLVVQLDSASQTWSVVSSPDTSPVLDNTLAGISCPGTADCWATGVANVAGGTTHTLIEHWDGSAWTIAPSPSPGPSNNYLTGVSCASATACWSSGGADNGTAQQALVEQYDGSAWTVASVPSTSPQQTNVLTGIACSDVAHCTATGYRFDNTGSVVPLAEAFDSGAWSLASIQSTPGNPNAGGQVNDFLDAVACASAVECWTFGYQFDWHGGSGGFLTLAEHGMAVDAPASKVPEAPVPVLLVAVGLVCIISDRMRRRVGR